LRGNQKNFIEKIALERIYRLFELAEKSAAKHPERSKRYAELAWKISLRNKAKIPAEFKSKFCRKCKSYFCGKNFESKKRENSSQ
jgi:ribonuclease P protein subunit RPR2